jgi:hypothetical protein
MPLAPMVVGTSCRRRDIDARRLHALLLAGAAAWKASMRAVALLLAGASAGEVSAHAACMHYCWQVLPPARHQLMPLACLVDGRSRRFRGIDACRLHPVMLAGAAAGEASAHAVGTHCCWHELPSARPQCMPHAGTVAGRSYRRRGTIAGPLHSLLLAGVAAGEASAHAARMYCCGQVRPLSRHRRVTFAFSVAGRRCRRRDLSVCRSHALLLAGAAAFEA